MNPLARETFSPETVVPNVVVFEEMLKATVSVTVIFSHAGMFLTALTAAMT